MRVAVFSIMSACLLAACSRGDDVARPTPASNAQCKSRDDRWSIEEAFAFANEQAPGPLPECVPNCDSRGLRRVDGIPNVTALPAGSCERSDAACDMGAFLPCRCDPTDGPVSQYRCRCEDQAWSCAVISPGGSACRNDCASDASD
jgi:hypothetical protein